MQPPPTQTEPSAFDRGFTPYAPPAAPSAYAAPTDGVLPGAQVALYKPGHVALATFLGTPFAGAVIYAMNERRLGRSRAATMALVYGALATAAILGISFALPAGVRMPLGFAPMLLMRHFATKNQGALVNHHIMAGGKAASAWSAFGIGIAFLAAVMISVFVVAMVAALVSPASN